MDEVRSFTDLVTNSATEFWDAVGSFMPKLVGAILLVILAAIVAKIAESLVRKILEMVGVNKLKNNEKVAKTLKTTEMDVDIVNVTARTAFWVVIVIFALSIAEVLGLNAMRDVIRELLAYLPSVLAGAIVLTVTVAGARLVRDALSAALVRMRVDYAKLVANVAYYALIVFGTLMAIDQLGFDTTILTANVTIIVAGFVLALALAFGLGGRDLAGRVLEQMYDNASKRTKK